MLETAFDRTGVDQFCTVEDLAAVTDECAVANR
jgi:hypothetical protein